MNGIALTVLISQLPKLFGFSIEGVGPLRDLVRIGRGIFGGQSNWTSFAIGAGHAGRDSPCQALPAHSGRADRLGRRHNRGGCPEPRRDRGRESSRTAATRPAIVCLADGQPAHLKDVIIGGCAAAIVSFADTTVLSRTYMARTRTEVDPNQEMIGLGAANLAAGLFHGFPISSSASRIPSPSRPVRRRSSPAWWAPSPSRSFSCSHPTC
jgi:hypothetical protein